MAHSGSRQIRGRNQSDVTSTIRYNELKRTANEQFAQASALLTGQSELLALLV